MTANCKKFGMPLYASAWADERTVLVAGGGGKRSSGIPNRICVATFDGETLSEPLFSLHTEETAPQALVMIPPARERVLCVFGGDVAVYDVAPNPTPPATMGETEESDPPPTSGAAAVPYTLAPASADSAGVAVRSVLAECDVKCAAFNSTGEVLAIGLEDGRAVLCEWRDATDDDLHLEPVAELERAHADAVTAVAFSPDDRFLLTVSSENAAAKGGQNASDPTRGPILWDVATRAKIGRLPWTRKSPADVQTDARIRSASFRHVGFGPTAASGRIRAYAVLNIDGEGHAIRWDVADAGAAGDAARWRVAARRRVAREPVSSAALGPDGTLAIGDAEGGVAILDAETLEVRARDKKSHMIFVTTAAFSPDGTALATGSADASCAARRAAAPSAAARVARIATLAIAAIVLAWVFLGVVLPLVVAMGSAASEESRAGAEAINLMEGVDLQDAAERAREELARMDADRMARAKARAEQMVDEVADEGAREEGGGGVSDEESPEPPYPPPPSDEAADEADEADEADFDSAAAAFDEEADSEARSEEAGAPGEAEEWHDEL